jgi:hypothetical protein
MSRSYGTLLDTPAWQFRSAVRTAPFIACQKFLECWLAGSAVGKSQKEQKVLWLVDLLAFDFNRS